MTSHIIRTPQNVFNHLPAITTNQLGFSLPPAESMYRELHSTDCKLAEVKPPTIQLDFSGHSLLEAYQYSLDLLSYFSYISKFYNRGSKSSNDVLLFIADQEHRMLSWGDSLRINSGILDKALKKNDPRELSRLITWQFVAYSEKIVDWFELIQPPLTNHLQLRQQFRLHVDAVKRDAYGEVDKSHLEFIKKGSWPDGNYWPPLRAGTGAREAAVKSLVEKLGIIMRVLEGSREAASAWIDVEEGRKTWLEALDVRLSW